jgi:hypothetical protein
MKTTGPFKIMSPAEPILVFDRETLSKVQYLVKKWELEAQWFHRVERVVDKPKRKIYYYISDIIIPKQECSAAYVESGAELSLALTEEIKQRTGGFNSEFNSIMSSLTCWCHSHVNMGVSPSGTDNTQFEEQIKFGSQGGQTGPQIMMIFNKKDEFFSRIYDRELGVLFENVDIHIQQPDIDCSYIDDALKNKLKTKTYKSVAELHPKVSGYITSGMDYDCNTKKDEVKKNLSGPTTSQSDTKRTLSETNRADSSSNNFRGSSLKDELALATIKALILSLENDSHQRPRLVNHIARETTNLLTPREIDVMNHLLFETEKEATKMVTMWFQIDEDEHYANSIKEFIAYLNSNTLDTNTFISAMHEAEALCFVDGNESQGLSRVKLWFAGTEDSMVNL